MGQDFGGKKYLWGNTPAFDVLNLESNEGVDYNEQLNLLFAGMFAVHLPPPSLS